MIPADVREANYLDALWATKDAHQDRRLALLKRLASVVIPRDATWDYAAIRVADPPHDLEHGCFVCRSRDWRLYRHHVIQLQHGGSNSVRNVVSLCHAHHRAVHPWLRPVTSWERRTGWVSVAELAATMAERLFA